MFVNAIRLLPYCNKANNVLLHSDILLKISWRVCQCHTMATLLRNYNKVTNRVGQLTVLHTDALPTILSK